MSNYYKNRLRARTVNNDPTLTDQSQARETDINIIVGNMIKHATQPTPLSADMGGDWSNFPRDLRGMIEMGKSLNEIRKQLPVELRNKTTAELLELTPRAIAEILAPPEEPKEKDKA